MGSAQLGIAIFMGCSASRGISLVDATGGGYLCYMLYMASRGISLVDATGGRYLCYRICST
jgi:hypothetical protein